MGGMNLEVGLAWVSSALVLVLAKSCVLVFVYPAFLNSVEENTGPLFAYGRPIHWWHFRGTRFCLRHVTDQIGLRNL